MLVPHAGGSVAEVLRGEGGSMGLRRGGNYARREEGFEEGFEEEEEVVVVAEVGGGAIFADARNSSLDLGGCKAFIQRRVDGPRPDGPGIAFLGGIPWIIVKPRPNSGPS